MAPVARLEESRRTRRSHTRIVAAAARPGAPPV